jgi:DNA-binding transcriptional MocR family regulator
MKDVADHLNLRLQGIAMDEQGLRADALEAACRAAQAQILYILPTLQNPTGTVMSIERRREIIAVARQFDLTIVEDDVYGFLLGDDRPPPLVALAPDIVYYITSMAKCLMPGLRVGFVATPPGAAEAVGGAMRTTVRMTAPLMAEIVAGWIADGSADAMAEQQRSAVETRQALAQRILKDFPTASDSSGFHIWLTLPEGWSSADFVAEAQRQGVVVMGAAPFRVGRGPEPQAIRICLGGPEVALDVERGLKIIAALLHRKSLPNRAII